MTILIIFILILCDSENVMSTMHINHNANFVGLDGRKYLIFDWLIVFGAPRVLHAPVGLIVRRKVHICDLK